MSETASGRFGPPATACSSSRQSSSFGLFRTWSGRLRQCRSLSGCFRQCRSLSSCFGPFQAVSLRSF
eukprot:9016517-Alexandrium_andersonii.AAC.1